MPCIQNKKLIFIKSFSDKEWLLSGWAKEERKLSLNVFETIALFVKDGHYLELGCGSGILCKFLYLFSGKKIVPYGIDINQEAVKIAKKNNPEFNDNFTRENYFESLKSNTFNLKKFSTISVFVGYGEHNWKKFLETLIPVVKECQKTNFLIIAYDNDFFSIKDKQPIKFVSVMEKISIVSLAGHSILVIGKDKKIHTTAEKLRKKILEHEKHTKRKFIDEKIIEGIIIKKNPSSFSLIEKSNPKHNQAKKLQFSFNSKQWQRFSEISFSPTGEIVSERIVDWKKIRKGAKVMVMYRQDRQKKIVFGVTKFI